jgi:hypothetical protein
LYGKVSIGFKVAPFRRRLERRLDVAVFKCPVGAFRFFPNHNIYYGPRQVVGWNYL